jgi:tRNA(Ile)-lysidine synthase TilS/MesJ
MGCIKCSKKAEITNLKHIGPACRSCFLKIIEKRVRKGLRTKKLIKKNDRILLIDNGSKEAKAGEFLLKSIIKDLPVKIDAKKAKKISSTKKYDKIIMPWSLDDEAEQFLSMVFNKKKHAKYAKKAVKLLKSLSEEEIEQFAKIKRFKYKKKQRSKTKQMLDKLEKRYPGYKFSLLNSIKQLNKTTKK